jgi:serine protease Do
MAMKDPFWKDTIWVALIALIIGAGSAILATSYTSSYLSDYALELSELTAPLRLTKPQPRSYPTSLNEAIGRFSSTVPPTMAVAYRAQSKQRFGLTEQDRAASGIVLTSDGWVVFDSVRGLSRSSLVAIDGRVFSTKEIVVDTLAGVTFVKVDASGLSVAGLASGLDREVGEQVFVSSSSDSMIVAMITSRVAPRGLKSFSDDVHRVYTFSMTPESGFVFSLNSELVGLIRSEETETHLVPVETFLSAFRSLLENGKIVRPALGLYTVSLTHSIGLDEEPYSSMSNGAWVPDTASIVRGGSAHLAGVVVGDVILRLDGQSIDAERTLDELLADHSAGDEVVLTILRDGTEMELTTTLAERSVEI